MNGYADIYFAYGSNLSPWRIRERIPGARPLGNAWVDGYRLVERLYADIEPCEGARVWGFLYVITEEEAMRLDVFEGFPRVYDIEGVNAHLDAKHSVVAYTYRMTEAAVRTRSGQPYPRDYRLICSAGAHARGIPNPFHRKGDPKFGFRKGCGWAYGRPE